MSIFINSILTPQTKRLYQLLLKKQQLFASEIATKMGILPNAVYRIANKLLELGLIEKTRTHPAQFKIVPTTTALNTFLATARQDFSDLFFAENAFSNAKNQASKLSISFIKDREELLRRTNEDLGNATLTADYIVSGFEVPAETMLTVKKAIDRGVKLRFLVQKSDEVDEKMLHFWKKIGIQVRYYSLLESRIFIFDSKTVYLTAYNPQEKKEAMGMRFPYAPIAKLMGEVFEQRWLSSEEIS